MKKRVWILPTALALAALVLQLWPAQEPAPGSVPNDRDTELAALRAQVAELSAALEAVDRPTATPIVLTLPAPVMAAPAPAPVPAPATAAARPDAVATTEADDAAAEDDWTPPAAHEPVFDLNNDEEVTADEVERGHELLVRASEFAHNRSSDGSYPILADDFEGDPRFFRAMDGNADGALSEREAITYFVESIRELRRFDQNHDGALAFSEFGHLKTRFAFLDTNADEKIEAWEINILRGRGKW